MLAGIMGSPVFRIAAIGTRRRRTLIVAERSMPWLTGTMPRKRTPATINATVRLPA